MRYADMLESSRARGLFEDAAALVFQHRVDVWIVFDHFIGDFRLFTGPHWDYILTECHRYQIVKVVRYKVKKKK
jgi:hypothetical protein